jgi:amidase
MTDLALRPAVELVAALRKGEVGARELLDHYLARVERLNPSLNAELGTLSGGYEPSPGV